MHNSQIKFFKYILISFILYIGMIFSVSANSQVHVVLGVGETKTVGNYQVTNTTDHKIFAPITDLSGKVFGNTSIDTLKQYGFSLNETDSNYPYSVGGFKIENTPVATNYCYAGGPVPCEITEYYRDIGNWDSSCLNGIIAQSVVCKNIGGSIVSSSNCTGLPYPTGYNSGYITGTCGNCGITNNSCTLGTLSDVVDSSTQYLWNCNGSVNGINQDDSICSDNKPVNCIGNWSDTSTCSETCGGGVKQQVYSITTPASNGGAACSNNDGDVRWGSSICNDQTCEITTTFHIYKPVVGISNIGGGINVVNIYNDDDNARFWCNSEIGKLGMSSSSDTTTCSYEILSTKKIGNNEYHVYGKYGSSCPGEIMSIGLPHFCFTQEPDGYTTVIDELSCVCNGDYSDQGYVYPTEVQGNLDISLDMTDYTNGK